MREYLVARAGDLKIPENRSIRSEGLDELVADICAHGMQTPILVDKDMNVIDGVRRLHCFSSEELVDVVTTDDYDDLFDILAKARDEWQLPFTPRRIYELHQALKPLSIQSRQINVVDAIRDRYAGKKRREGVRHGLTRMQMARVSGVSEHTIQVIVFIYARASGEIYEHNPENSYLAESFVTEIDAGTMSPHTAYRLYRTGTSTGPRTTLSAGEQRKAMSSVSQSLNALMRTLRDIGPIAAGITPEERKDWVRTLRTASNDFNYYANVFTRKD
jgi:ParB-like nuclease family protein